MNSTFAPKAALCMWARTRRSLGPQVPYNRPSYDVMQLR